MKSFLADGDIDVARSHLREAAQVYQKWRGVAKMKQLREELSTLTDIGQASF